MADEDAFRKTARKAAPPVAAPGTEQRPRCWAGCIRVKNGFNPVAKASSPLQTAKLLSIHLFIVFPLFKYLLYTLMKTYFYTRFFKR